MNDKAVPVRSARELAEELLAFREAYAPDSKRFHERALIVDNGGRGSDRKAVVFTGDDLSALLMDLRGVEADRDAIVASLTDELRTVKARVEQLRRPVPIVSEAVIAVGANIRRLTADLFDLRQRHDRDVLMAWHEGEKWGEAHPLPLCTDRNDAWLASEAKAALEQQP